MKTFNLLLAEDNAGDVIIFRETFEEANFDVHIQQIDNGEAAIEYLLHLLEQTDPLLPDVVF